MAMISLAKLQEMEIPVPSLDKQREVIQIWKEKKQKYINTLEKAKKDKEELDNVFNSMMY